MTIEHSSSPTGEIHPVCNWNYPNTAARTGASGFIAEDIGKAAWQQDDDSFWILKTATSPAWVPFGGSIPGADGSPGAPGTPGAAGSVWRSGSGAPSNALGVDGDYYLNGANGDVSQRETGVYNVKVNIKGPPGTGGTPAWGGITGLLSAQTDLQSALAAKATLADINTAIAALVATAPATLDTLNELAAALGNDSNFATTITTALAGKAATGHTHPGVYEPADPTIAKTGAGQTFTKPQIAGVLALASGAAWDGSLATGKQHLTANVNGGVFTVANPSAQANGAVYMVVVTYTTAHSIAWGSMFKGTAAFTPTATAGATDIFHFRSNGTNLIRAGYALNGGA